MYIEDRIAALERQVAALTDEVRTLRAALDAPPPALTAPAWVEDYAYLANKPALTTREAALLLGRKPGTLRIWSMNEDGPVLPRRIGRRLVWDTKEVFALLAGKQFREVVAPPATTAQARPVRD